MSNAPRTGEDALAWYRAQHAQDTRDWRRKCLAAARTARGLPAVYPTANAAAHATPLNERVTDLSRIRRGMVAFYGDPNDDNPADHIVTVAGWDGPRTTLANLRVWSNDTRNSTPGSLNLVAGDFFPRHWGDPFMFAAGWLNGYNFADLDAARVPAPPANPLGADFDAAIAALRKAIRGHRANGHKRITAALVTDLNELLETRAKYGR